MGKEDKDYHDSDWFELRKGWDWQEQDPWADENMNGVVFLTPRNKSKGWDFWSDKFRRRKEEHKENGEIPERVAIRLPETSVIAFIGDLHVGSPNVDYDRIAKEMELIVNTKNMYAILMGDLIDGFFFNPAQMEQMEQPPEQIEYMRELIRYLGDAGKLLVGIGGDHDEWMKRMGMSAVHTFTEESGAYYMHGASYIDILIGKQEYRIAAAHRFPGFSMYNNTHSQRRALNESARGADIIVSGHTHRKGISQHPVDEWGGESRLVHLHSVGPYKSNDEYSRKLGFGRQSTSQMYGTAVKLHLDYKEIESYWDIEEAARNAW